MTNLIEDAIAALRQVETLETREVHVGYENGMTSQAYVYEDYLPAKDVLAIVNATLARLEQEQGSSENETAWLIERDDIATMESGNRVCLHYYGEWRKGSHYWTPDHAKAKRFATADEALKETNGDPVLRVAEHMWMAMGEAQPVAWMPIETAPKGEFLLFYEDEAIRLGFWNGEKFEEASFPVLIDKFGNRLVSRELEHRGERMELAFSLYSPTHWRPLPSAPGEPCAVPVAPQPDEEMRKALEKCRDQLQFYATEHKAKSDAAYKAWDDARYWGNVDEQNAAHKEYHKRLTQTQTNEAMVAMIEQTLSTPPAQDQKEEG